ncbi:MAG: protein translocase subunit SecD [Pseudomonadota bacterium]
MNQFPTWKYLLVLAVVVFGVLAAMPNFYGNAPAVQLTGADGDTLDEVVLKRYDGVLNAAGFAPSGEFIRDGRVFYTFDDIDTQSGAFEALRDLDDDEVSVAKTLASLQPAWLRTLGLEPMSLGLDLRGGVYLLFEVDLAAAIENRLNVYVDEIGVALREEGITRRVRLNDNTIQVELREAEDLDAARRAVSDVDGQLQLLDGANDRSFRVRMTELQIRERQNFAMEQNITTLRNRVDALGVAEPVIQRQGLQRIVVQLPGIQDPAEAKRILGATATLQFRLVDQTGNAPGAQSYPYREGGTLSLKREVIASGDQIVDASSGFSEGQPAVNIRLDAVGGANMLKTTQQNLNKPMAVLFITSNQETVEVNGTEVKRTVNDFEIINRANIRGTFSNQFQITGVTSNEARDLALLLKAGALAAPLFQVGEQTIGPSRGQDNIDRGFKAIQIGFLAVVVFMVLYYRVFGVIANLALLTNLLLIVGFLSLLQASLTLPGIAGIVLTVGMAVDANVLIFERIREELDAKNTVQGAISAGYDKAFSSIADANVTTFIAALVLFMFGTGPVKGFAVTLAIGILTSMFTAIVGTRAVVNLLYGGRKLDKLPV